MKERGGFFSGEGWQLKKLIFWEIVRGPPKKNELFLWQQA